MTESSPAATRATTEPERPDIETSSQDYARRFSGKSGAYLLAAQDRAVLRVLRGLPPGTALDVGGGHGQLVGPLTRAGWRVTVQGTDHACERNLRELHGHGDCTFVRSELFELPFSDHSIDLVIAVRLISHVTDWRRLLGEMCRVARRSVVIDYPSKFALNALTPILFGLKRSLEGNTRTYLSFDSRELRAELARHHFGRVSEIKQFALPMVVHRMANAAAPLRAAERVAQLVGVTQLVGSPIILRADYTPKESNGGSK